jgi:hypothetical protein
MNTNETLIEIVNHIINTYPELSSHSEFLATLGLGKGFNSLDKSTAINSLKRFLTAEPLLAIEISENAGDYSIALFFDFSTNFIATNNNFINFSNYYRGSYDYFKKSLTS